MYLLNLRRASFWEAGLCLRQEQKQRQVVLTGLATGACCGSSGDAEARCGPALLGHLTIVFTVLLGPLAYAQAQPPSRPSTLGCGNRYEKGLVTLQSSLGRCLPTRSVEVWTETGSTLTQLQDALAWASPPSCLPSGGHSHSASQTLSHPLRVPILGLYRLCPRTWVFSH